MFFQGTKIDRALVFSRTKHGADKVVRFLEAGGIRANAIHGNKSQPQRERALGEFRSGEVPVLVATDIAARGIDIPGVSHVINYDLPNVPEQYVHRIGRTARAGADGIAIAYCAEDERAYLRDIEKLTRQKLGIVALPEGFVKAVEAMKSLKPAPRRAPQPNQRNKRNESGARGHSRDPQRFGIPPGHDPRADMPQSEQRPRSDGRRPSAHPSLRADRREDGQRRENRNERQSQQRHPQRADGHPAHRANGGGRPGGPGQNRGNRSGARRPGSRFSA
jgi:ATP-dependent RNA helicase RhlE